MTMECPGISPGWASSIQTVALQTEAALGAKARAHTNNAHRKGCWPTVARWDDDVKHRKALLNKGWDRSYAEHSQCERDKPKQ